MELHWDKFQVLPVQCVVHLHKPDGSAVSSKSRLSYLGANVVIAIVLVWPYLWGGTGGGEGGYYDNEVEKYPLTSYLSLRKMRQSVDAHVALTDPSNSPQMLK